MAQDIGLFNQKSQDYDPGPGLRKSFALCFLADLAIVFAIGFSHPGPFIGADGKLPLFVSVLIPLAANGIAIYWAATTHRERCLKGLIICTALMVLLDGACFGLMS